MNEPYSSLLKLQELDLEIAKAEVIVAEFAPRLQELRGPITALEKEVEQSRAKLEELRTQSKKLELGAENKREKLRVYQERVEKSRNIRDEAATRTEMDLIRRAVDAEVAEGQDTAEQARRQDMKLDDLEKALAKVREEIAPGESEFQSQLDEARKELKVLMDKRENQALHTDKAAVRLYDRVRSGKRKTALAPLTLKGACGICFNTLPMQEQAEIRQGTAVRCCEACGVILYPVD